MNKQKFVEFIRHPDNLTSKDLEEIDQVIESYPYFQNARIIMAKGSKIKDLPKNKEMVASAAIYATNRALLKKYINDELIFIRSLEVHESVQTDGRPKPPTPLPEEKVTPVLENENKEETKSEVDFEVEIPETTSENIKEEIPETDMVNSNGEEAVFEEEHTDLDDLISDLWHDVDELRKSKARFLEIEKRIEEDDAVNEAVKKATQKKPATKTASSKSTPKKAPASTTKSKASTASAKKATVKKTATKTKKPAAKKASSKSSPSKSDSSSNTSESPKKEDKSDPKALQNKIIDKFIEINPSMPKGGKSLDSSLKGDLSEKSTSLNTEIVSEYLAEIFLEQGKNDRAIEIYQTLSLKFPEKKSYFASLIKKLN